MTADTPAVRNASAARSTSGTPGQAAARQTEDVRPPGSTVSRNGAAVGVSPAPGQAEAAPAAHGIDSTHVSAASEQLPQMPREVIASTVTPRPQGGPPISLPPVAEHAPEAAQGHASNATCTSGVPVPSAAHGAVPSSSSSRGVGFAFDPATSKVPPHGQDSGTAAHAPDPPHASTASHTPGPVQHTSAAQDPTTPTAAPGRLPGYSRTHIPSHATSAAPAAGVDRGPGAALAHTPEGAPGPAPGQVPPHGGGGFDPSSRPKPTAGSTPGHGDSNACASASAAAPAGVGPLPPGPGLGPNLQGPGAGSNPPGPSEGPNAQGPGLGSNTPGPGLDPLPPGADGSASFGGPTTIPGSQAGPELQRDGTLHSSRDCNANKEYQYTPLAKVRSVFVVVSNDSTAEGWHVPPEPRLQCKQGAPLHSAL